MDLDEFKEAFGGEEPDEQKIALQMAAAAQADYFRALRASGLSIIEAAAIIAAAAASYVQTYQESKEDENGES